MEVRARVLAAAEAKTSRFVCEAISNFALSSPA